MAPVSTARPLRRSTARPSPLTSLTPRRSACPTAPATSEAPVATDAPMSSEATMASEAPMETEAAAPVCDVVDTAISAGGFATLIAAVQAAGLEETLRGEGPFTVFAPTDDAFAALSEGTVDTLLADPAGDLTSILTYHVVP